MNELLVKDAEKICLERGLRFTPLRSEVLLLIAVSGQPIKAYDLLDRMHAAGAVVAPPTLYRALDFLLENGFIHKLESINAFVACRAPHTPHIGAFLVCNRCRKATELIDERLQQLIDVRLRALRFVADTRSQTLEVYGSCVSCSLMSLSRTREGDTPPDE